MKISKGQGMSLFSAIAIFGIFNTVVFLAPLAHTVVFWLGYFFALFALITMALTLVLYFGKPVKEDKFLSLPAVKVSWAYFVLQTALSIIKFKNHLKSGCVVTKNSFSAFCENLPFELTNAQKRVINECIADMQSGRPMTRLVQGDVGSGKTLVAAGAIWAAAQSSKVSAMMAPTEILAEQHYESLQRLFAPLGIRVGLLTGSMTAKEKRLTREAIASGEIQLAVGTHALLSDATQFNDLGLVITDEQHRFGVGQRAQLSSKGSDPHLLVMSATPIPRTLALLIYGDLDVSILDELPPGRQPVMTRMVSEAKRQDMYGFLQREIDAGGQAYIVCPLVEQTDTSPEGLQSAVENAERLAEKDFAGYRVGMLHGRMKPAEKEAVMSDFAAGRIQLLVSTTVIEVGVDVPNATVMLIQNAERFGLSQLHQLRGRVGRGKAKSYCILTSHNKNTETFQRLKALCKTTDGFKIAEEDLKLRGPGDFFGSRQSGLPAFRVADLSFDLATLKEAQAASAQWIEAYGTSDLPEAKALRERIGELFRRAEGTMN